MTRGAKETAAAIRVLLVEDSVVSRAELAHMLEAIGGVKVVGAARDGEEALREAIRLVPDLVVLDLQMPRMDGFTFLRLLMARRPTPVIVVSSQSHRSDAFKALELGALDFIAKPESGTLEAIRGELAEKCELLRSLRLENLAVGVSRTDAPSPGASLAEPARVVAIGASTGGPTAIQRLLSALAGNVPLAFVVAQHMPERFTAAFAERLSRTTPFSAKEAADGDVVAAGRVLVAPGGHHLEVRRDSQGTLRAAVVAAEPSELRKYCPSANRLFASVARALGARACAVVLTGMGRDGCDGVSVVKRHGGLTLAESAETAVVYGMPQAAAESGSIDEVLALPSIAARIAALGNGA